MVMQVDKSLMGVEPQTALETVFLASGEVVTLTDCIAESGEGRIWRTQNPIYVAKIYRAVEPLRIRKLLAMVASAPIDPNAKLNHISFAWPLALLHDAQGIVLGFLMRAIADSVDLMDVYNPLQRQRTFPNFNWLYLHGTALNIASITWAIHQAGYVIGDMKPQNILVNSHALPAFIDTDSFQLQNPNSPELFHCQVGSEGYTPPELISADLSITRQTVVHDYFRLGIIIYQLLMGDHPHKGQWQGLGDAPSPTELLQQGLWPYGPDPRLQPSPLTLPLDTVHPAIQACFQRCFTAGHAQPEARPTPWEWVSALKLAIANLQSCQKIKTHRYSRTYGHCHWCDRHQFLGVDIFATPERSRLNPLKTAQRHWPQWTASLAKQSWPKSQAKSQALSQPKSLGSQALHAKANTQVPHPSTNQQIRPSQTTRLGSQFQSPPRISVPSILNSWQGVVHRNLGHNMLRRSRLATSQLRIWPIVILSGVILLGLLSRLVMLAQSTMTAEDLQLTSVGTLFCMLLIFACVGLGKLTNSP